MSCELYNHLYSLLISKIGGRMYYLLGVYGLLPVSTLAGHSALGLLSLSHTRVRKENV